MSEKNPPLPQPSAPEDNPASNRVSPVRPIPPAADQPAASTVIPAAEPKITATLQSPVKALETLRRKMEHIASEFAAGNINRAQFNAIYRRYDEQRTIIERLTERNPGSDAWQQVARPGHTSFLRSHFEARCIYYLVHLLEQRTPLMMGGEQQPETQRIQPVLESLYQMPNRPVSGLARKEMDNNHWMVLALSQHAFTIAMYNLEPSRAQINRVRDLHNDFERANRDLLKHEGSKLERMVFPQRALVEF